MEMLQEWLASLPLERIPYNAVLDLVNNKMRVSPGPGDPDSAGGGQQADLHVAWHRANTFRPVSLYCPFP